MPLPTSTFSSMKHPLFWSLLLSFFAVGTQASIEVGLVLDKGGKDDKSFNASAYAGLVKAQKELGIRFKDVQATDNNAFEPLLRALASKKYDLIVAVGFAQTEALKKVAPQFPNKKFVIVDGQVEATNVKSAVFAEHEGSFLVGALAGLTTRTHHVGFLGGMDIPMIRRFEMGYRAGVQKTNPKAKITSNFIGISSEAWNNPARAKELALTQYKAGADIIFGAAGASNTGIFDAAEDRRLFAIGVDSNQNWVKPGRILTSMLKRVDVAVFDTCQEVIENRFQGGVKQFDLKNKGVDFALDEHNSKLLSPESIQKIENLKNEIIKGTLQVPDFYKQKK